MMTLVRFKIAVMYYFLLGNFFEIPFSYERPNNVCVLYFWRVYFSLDSKGFLGRELGAKHWCIKQSSITELEVEIAFVFFSKKRGPIDLNFCKTVQNEIKLQVRQ